jgi:NADH dehydrogenase (ubiquinone) 1 alpha subcomplex subunit 9
MLIAKTGKAVWWPTLSTDQVERRYLDDVDTPGDWDVVGVTPEEIEDSAIVYLRRYRSACVSSVPFHVHLAH